VAARADWKAKSPRWVIAVRCLRCRHRGVIAERDRPLRHQAGRTGGPVRQTLALSPMRQRRRNSATNHGEKRRLSQSADPSLHQISSLRSCRSIIGDYANAGANNQQSPPNVAKQLLAYAQHRCLKKWDGCARAPEPSLAVVNRKPFTLLPITSRLSCCLKLTSFNVFNVVQAKNENNRGASKHGDTKHCENF
jgi:hypothetical protein